MNPQDILLVEDNPDDVELTRIAFVEAGIDRRLVVVRDGAEALDYLFARGTHADREGAELPAIVLLDLNLPELDGREVLQGIRSDERTRNLPVVVLTTSSAEEDILKSYNLHANCYVVKPVEFESFVKAVQSIQHFWFSVVTLPPGKESA